MTENVRVAFPADTGACAVDFDECTITLAFSSEEQTRQYFAVLPKRNRVRVINTEGDNFQTIFTEGKPKPITLRPEAIAALKDALKRGNAMAEDEDAGKLELLHDWLANYIPICLGECEFCRTQLIEGEPGWRYSESTVCAACAPSYGEVKLAAEHEPDTWETEDGRLAALADIQMHIEAGGSLDDTMTVTL